MRSIYSVKKISIEWFVVTLVALLGVGCLYASHQMEEELAQKESVAIKRVAE